MISIFFSSTFKDMQCERDIIQKYVRPRAEVYAEQHSESINFIDLRWGIDTSRMNEQDAMDKIISVCKDKILDSYPYFIGLLGREYGSEVDSKLRDNSCLTVGERIGVTEYEISTRLKLGNDNLAFFIRKDVDEINPRAQELRDAIIKKCSGCIQFYDLSNDHSADCFINKIYQTVCKFIDHKISMRSLEHRYMNYIYSMSESITSRFLLQAKIFDAIHSDNDLVIVTGPEGIGKKSVIYKTIAENDFNAIGVRSYGNLCESNVNHIYEELLSQIFPFLGNGFSMPAVPLTEKMKLQLALQHYEDNCSRYLVVVLEDIYRQVGKDWMRKILSLPVRGWRKIKFCITAEKFEQEKIPNLLSLSVIPVSFLFEDEKRKIIDLECRKNSKELPKIVVDRICSKSHSGQPFYISMLLKSMILFDQNDLASIQNKENNVTGTVGDRIANGILQYVENLPDDLKELYLYISHQNAIRTNSDVVNRIISLISCTKFGLREQDLKAIIIPLYRITELDFYHIFNYISYQLLCDHEGRYSLRVPVWSITDSVNSSEYLLCDYLNGLPTNDIVRKNELVYLYAVLHRIDKSLEELSTENALSEERKVVLGELLKNYHDNINKEILNKNIRDGSQWRAVLNLSYNLLGMSNDEVCTQIIFELTKMLVDKVFASNYDDTTSAYLYGIIQNSVKIAEKLYHEEEKRLWDTKANDLFGAMMDVSLSDHMGTISVLFKIIQIQMQITKDVERTRKGLDQGLPNEVLIYIIKSIEKKYEQIHTLTRDNKYLVMCISGYGQVLGLFYELQGDIWIRKGNKTEAFYKYKFAIEVIESYDENSHGNKAVFYMKLGNVCEQKGEIIQSLHYYEMAYNEFLEITEEVFSVDTEINMALALAHMGNSYVKMGEYGNARRYLKKANVCFKKVYEATGTERSAGDYATGLYKIGELAFESGKNTQEGKEAVLQAAMIMYELINHTGDPEWINNLQICMRLYKKLGGKI